MQECFIGLHLKGSGVDRDDILRKGAVSVLRWEGGPLGFSDSYSPSHKHWILWFFPQPPTDLHFKGAENGVCLRSAVLHSLKGSSKKKEIGRNIPTVSQAGSTANMVGSNLSLIPCSFLPATFPFFRGRAEAPVLPGKDPVSQTRSLDIH